LRIDHAFPPKPRGGSSSATLKHGHEPLQIGYCGEDKRVGLYQVDPRTGKVTVVGPLGPSHRPNGVWAYTLAADERYVYLAGFRELRVIRNVVPQE